MHTMEERIAYVDGQVSELSNTLRTFRADLIRIEARVDNRFDRMDERMARQFHWLVGLQITTLLAIAGALLARA